MLALRSRLFSSLVNLRGVVAPAAVWDVGDAAAESVPGGGEATEAAGGGGGCG